MPNNIENRDNVDCVVMRCGGCERVVYASVNIPRRDISKMVEDGFEHMTAAEVRTSDPGCKCAEIESK